jgi:hypothetical protein
VGRPSQRRRRFAIAVGCAAVAAEAVALRVQSGRLAGRVVVRCRAGHLFTTIWIPGVSIKSARLVWWRVQWCPVGRHVTLVRPVREERLAQHRLDAAHAVRDLPVP